MIPFFKRKSTPAVDSAAADVDVEIDVVVDLEPLGDDELELTDDDFVLLEAAPPAPPISRSILRDALAAVPLPDAPASRPISEARLETLRAKAVSGALQSESEPMPLPSQPMLRPSQPMLLPPHPESVREVRRAAVSRLTWDVDAEASVADECLASIAAAASHARASDPLIPVAPPSSVLALRPRDEIDELLDDAAAIGKLPPASMPARAVSSRAMIPPPASSSAIALSPRLPPVSPPPFVRSAAPSGRISVPGLADVTDANDAVETLPVPMPTPFARTMTDERASRPSVVPSPAPVAGSVAPVAVSRNDATVIVVRDRPRAYWVIAAAAIGAVAAVTVMRLAAPHASSAPTASIETPPAAATAAPAVVRFGEEEGVSIKLAAAPSASHAARPASVPVQRTPAHAQPAHAPSLHSSRPLNPKVSPPTPLPDGSLGLASNTSSKPTSSSSSVAAPAPTPLPLPPTGGRKHPLTPEQELAEAQLRAASMR